MKMYFLCRKEDVSGTSGTGHIAQVAEFDDGVVVVRWVAEMNAAGVASTTVFNSLGDVLRIHGHEGRTGVDLVVDSERVQQLENSVTSLRECLRSALETLKLHGLRLPPCPLPLPDLLAPECTADGELIGGKEAPR